MAITPQTNLKLLKCNLNLDNNNQINFSTATAQYNYFNSLTKLEASNFTYQRKDNVIRYPAHIDSIIDYNYVMYQNSNYTNKWFYAYIVKMEYVNDNMTYIYIKTDSFQTWQFDLTYMRSFVEREHVNSDTIGLHTLDEPVGTGEYINNGFGTFNTQGTATSIIIGVSKLLTGMTYWNNRFYNGVYSGLYLYTFTTHDNVSMGEYISRFIKCYDQAGYGGDIVQLYTVPSDFVNVPSGDWITQNDVPISEGQTTTLYYGLVKANSAYSSTPVQIDINTTLDGYTPKNNKLFTAPFNYLYLSNNVGADVVYHYEDFTSNTPKFLVEGTISLGGSTRVYPINYKRQSDDPTLTAPRCSYQYGITAGKLPVCSWNSDSYTNWITQNSVNVATGYISGLTATASGIVTGNPIGIMGGIGQVANSLGSMYSASMIPNNVGGNTSGSDISFSTRNLNVTYSKMSVRSEVAKVIDDFFSIYGYHVNLLKVPNITGRRNWNYVKTINANIEAYIPQEDLDEIKKMFDNGITIWHNTSTFLDYSQNNDII